MPDETTILRFSHLLDKHQLAPQVLSTINAMLTQQGLMLKTGTIVDATIIAAPGYQGVDKREETQGGKTQWHVAMRPGKRRALDPERLLHQLLEKTERLTASVRAKVEHPFRVIKQQFGYAKVRYRGLNKNTFGTDRTAASVKSFRCPNSNLQTTC